MAGPRCGPELETGASGAVSQAQGPLSSGLHDCTVCTPRGQPLGLFLPWRCSWAPPLTQNGPHMWFPYFCDRERCSWTGSICQPLLPSGAQNERLHSCVFFLELTWVVTCPPALDVTTELPINTDSCAFLEIIPQLSCCQPAPKHNPSFTLEIRLIRTSYS